MGLSLDELNAVIAARKESNKNYMFMETTVFQREFLYVKQLHEKGELGRIQYMTCAIIRIWKAGLPTGMAFLLLCIPRMQ